MRDSTLPFLVFEFPGRRKMSRFFVNVPFSMLLDRVDEAIARTILPEIVLDAAMLDGFDQKEAQRLADSLKSNGLENTLHGPFRDLSPGGVDSRILTVTRQRIDQTMEVAEILRPRCIVFHSGFDPWRYRGYEDVWLERSQETWARALEKAQEIHSTLAIENVFERTPDNLVSLIERMGSPRFRHCFDVGHLNAFGDTPLERWVESTAPYIAEIHLHDNTGDGDDHLPMGKGNIDFPLLFRLVRDHIREEPIYNLEPEREEDLEPSIQGFLQFVGKTRE
jgi:sugar phosphate isomerase/epimerase